MLNSSFTHFSQILQQLELPDAKKKSEISHVFHNLILLQERHDNLKWYLDDLQQDLQLAKTELEKIYKSDLENQKRSDFWNEFRRKF